MLLALTAAVGGDFTKTLTPEKIRASGLAKLTPDELAELEAMIEQYKTGDASAAPAVAAAKQAPPAPPAAKALPKWVAALVTLERLGSQADKAEVMESRLQGVFKGWNGRTIFRLENGQVWGQANSDKYEYTPPLNSPKVQVFPASVGTFWLKIEGVNQRCRVKPLKME